MEAKHDQSYNQIVITVYESLFRYWRGKGFGRAEAEDLAQEGICKGIARVDSFSGRAKLATFLTTVGKNQGIDYLRKEGTQAKLKDAVFDAAEMIRAKRQRRTPKAKLIW
jgi:RNA polymerase sigma factor (sigma-70 family)